MAVRFSSPVRVVSVRHPDGTHRNVMLRRASRLVPIGVVADGEHLAGTALVAGVPRPWERLPEPVRVNWFPAGPAAHVLVRPALDSKLTPSAPIILTFSRPVAAVLAEARPVLEPHVSGTWHQPNDHTLVFQPSGLGFPLGRRVHLRLPAAVDVISGSDPARYKTLTWQVPRGSLAASQATARGDRVPAARLQPCGTRAGDGRRTDTRGNRAAGGHIRLAVREDAVEATCALGEGGRPRDDDPRRDHGVPVGPRDGSPTASRA